MLCFQYPQTDRYPCNPLSYSLSTRWRTGFQYPQTDRYPCNEQYRRSLSPDGKLSVSSNGSIPLQLQPGRRATVRDTRLSVSSNGSIPPQRGRARCRCITVIPFSILKRIDTPATPRNRRVCG